MGINKQRLLEEMEIESARQDAEEDAYFDMLYSEEDNDGPSDHDSDEVDVEKAIEHMDEKLKNAFVW